MSAAVGSKQRMLAATASLLQRQGYHATGLNQIVREAKAPKGSLYFHFPEGKEELAQLALEQSGAATRDEVMAVLARHPHPADAVEAITLHLAQQLAASNYEEGCPVATVVLEAASSSARLQGVCARHYGAWTDAAAAYLRHHGVEAKEAESLATLLLASIEGGLLLARARQDTTPLRHIAAQLKAIVAARVD
jgi:TetR/AcrR family transcriptional repressor of lmrAB and yxaGH operons